MRRLVLVILAWAAASPGLAQTVTMDSAACRALLVEHRPAADVDYKPGTDVRGRPVAPADLGAGTTPSVLAPSFTFDLRTDLAPFLPPGSRLIRPELTVGRIAVDPKGAILFNGEPVAAGDRTALAALCRRAPR
ncbi:MAG: hypothetical protein JNK67_19090 [Alphaproteobacteria bacterium]|nr:hypothetical protein [Alphaproteobacteria bacterium]